MFEQMISNLKKKYKASKCFCVFDCPKEENWRFKYYTNYKANRSLRDFNGDIFKITFDLLKSNEVVTELAVSELEADDVIAIAVDVLHEIENQDEIVIITNDNDYIQLLAKYPDLMIVNLEGKEIKDRVDDIDTYLETKIIQGDKSDNIPSIGKLIGPKTAAKFAKNPELLAKYFDKNPEAKKQYELNKTLIAFESINPTHRSAASKYIKAKFDKN